MRLFALCKSPLSWPLGWVSQRHPFYFHWS